MKKILWDLQPNIKPSSGNTVDEREVELYEHLGSRSCLEYPQRYLTWACVNLHTLDRQLGRLHDTEPMNDSCVACSGWVVPGNGIRIYPWFMFWLFGSHSLCCDALIQGRGWGGGEVLPFLNVHSFIDSSWEALPFKRSWWRLVCGGSGRVAVREGGNTAVGI